MLELILPALISLAGNVVVATAFTVMGRAHAKERKFYVNTALSQNTYEFAVRQSASQEQRPEESQNLEYQFPEGL